MTYGGGSGLKFFTIGLILLQHGTTSEIVLAAKSILFHFRGGFMLK